MDSIGFLGYSLFALCFYSLVALGVILMDWIVQNWEVIGLILSNIAALFVNPPKRKK